MVPISFSDVWGKSLIFPLQLDDRGSVVLGNSLETIQNSLKTIFNWPKLTRYFTEKFGQRLYELLEEPNDQIVITLAKYYAKEAISLWENRIDILAIGVTQSDSSLKLNINYRIKDLDLIDTFTHEFNPNILHQWL